MDLIAEKRKFLRIDLQKKARCKFLGVEGNKFSLLSMVNVIAHIVNLSAGGACLNFADSVSACAAKEDGLVELELPLRQSAINLSGKIMWCEKTDTGVKAGVSFDDITEDERQKLVNYLNEELRFARLE